MLVVKEIQTSIGSQTAQSLEDNTAPIHSLSLHVPVKQYTKNVFPYSNVNMDGLEVINHSTVWN